MPSAHYETVARYLQESVKSLSDASGEVKAENRAVWNICNAIFALSDALQDEFICLNTRLNFLEQQLNRQS
ncbi:MAG: hypothetical protein DMG36_14360 [Acidobacteria bacterium]|nr:MAG: hypothetical protein DMG36_14360 [Acidobacteriota bacterium]